VGALNMSGNAREWVLDVEIGGRDRFFFYEKLARGEVSSVDPCFFPSGWASNASHVVRGASFLEVVQNAQGVSRGAAVGSDDVTGFRVALSLDGSQRPRGLPPYDGR
jgi:hypothetical protein